MGSADVVPDPHAPRGSREWIAAQTDVPRQRERPRRVVAAIVAAVVMTALTGVVPLWAFLSVRLVPDGASLTATVTGRAEAAQYRTTDNRGGTIVEFRLEDGRTGTVYVGRRLNAPDPGDQIAVHRVDGAWASPERYPVPVLVGALAGLLFWPAATWGWLRHVRRRSARPTS